MYKIFITFLVLNAIIMPTLHSMDQDKMIQNSDILGKIKMQLLYDLKRDENKFVQLFNRVTKADSQECNFYNKVLMLKAEKEEFFELVTLGSELAMRFNAIYGAGIKELCGQRYLFRLFPNENKTKISLAMEVTLYDKEWDNESTLKTSISYYYQEFLKDK